MKGARLFISFWFILFSVSSSYAGIDEGIQFLSSQSQQDGSYATESDIATAYQSTAEVLETFSALNQTQQPGFPEAIQFLQNESGQTTESLSHLIMTYAEQG